jgi:hypothetical protein
MVTHLHHFSTESASCDACHQPDQNSDHIQANHDDCHDAYKTVMVAQLLEGRLQTHRITHGNGIEHFGGKLVQEQHGEKIQAGHDQVHDADQAHRRTAKHSPAAIHRTRAATDQGAAGKHEQSSEHHKADADKPENGQETGPFCGAFEKGCGILRQLEAAVFGFLVKWIH